MWIKCQISRFITIIKCFTFFHHDRIKVHKSIRRIYKFHWFEYPKTVNSVAMYSNPKITPNYTTLLLCSLNNIVQDTTQQQSGSMVGQRACYQHCITELLEFYSRLTGGKSSTLTNNKLRTYCKIGAVQYSLNMVQLTTPGILIILGPEMATFHNLQHIHKAYYHVFPLNFNTFKKAKANSRY